MFELDCSWVLLGSTDDGGGSNSNNSNSNNTSGSNSNNNGVSPHGGSSSNSGSSIASTPSLPTLSSNKPCDQLKKTTMDSIFKSKLQLLKDNVNNATASNMNFETAFTQSPTDTTATSYNYNYHTGPVNSEILEFLIPAGGYVSGFFHTHYSTRLLSIFSLDDIKDIYDMAISGHIYDETFTAIVITKHGTTYALKFDNPQSLVNFGNQWFDMWWDTDPASIPDIVDNKSKRIRKNFKKIDPLKSIEKNEKNFAKFLDKNNVGMSLYKSNANFTQWSKVETNGDLTPCN